MSGDPSDAPANLLSAGDPLAAEVLAGLSYADQDAALPDPDPAPRLRARRASRRSDELRLDGDGVAARIAPGPVPLDRDRVTALPRTLPPPPGTLVITGSSGDVSPADGTRVVVFGGRGGLGTIRAARRAAAERRSTVIAAETFGHPVTAARLLVQLAASGVDVHVTPSSFELLGPWVDPDVLAIAAAGVPEEEDLAWASRVARMKTLVWMRHDRELGWSSTDGVWSPNLRVRRPARVSVVLPTMRPSYVDVALAQIATQVEVDIEVVLLLHGFDEGQRRDAEAVAGASGLDSTVVHLPADVPFGAAMNEAIARAEAPLVAKWDDDDLYGPFHLADLEAARRATGAALVGKYAEFIHFEEDGETVWRRPQGAETDTTSVAGGTLLAEALALADVGGFAPVGRAIDHHLRTRVAARGLRVFRTHGFGYALVRHGRGHTWNAPDDELRRGAAATFVGTPAALQLRG